MWVLPQPIISVSDRYNIAPTDEESNHDVSSLLSSVGRSLAMLVSANQRSQESVTDLALEINRILSKHNLDVHKRCVQDVLDVKQVRSDHSHG